jgi:hypothetical protein
LAAMRSSISSSGSYDKILVSLIFIICVFASFPYLNSTKYFLFIPTYFTKLIILKRVFPFELKPHFFSFLRSWKVPRESEKGEAVCGSLAEEKG